MVENGTQTDSEASLDFRPAMAEDFEFAHDLARLNMEAYVIRHFGGWRCDIFAENYSKGLNYILWGGGLRVGYVRLLVQTPVLFLDDFQIAPLHQGQGLGSSLLQHLDSLLPSFACTAMRLRVYHENPARGLYLRAGFQEIERSAGTSILERKSGVVEARSAR